MAKSSKLVTVWCIDRGVSSTRRHSIIRFMGRLSPVQILTLLSLAGIHAFVPAIPNAAAVGRVTMMSSVGREGGSMLMGVGQGGAGAAWAENMCRQALSGIALEYPHKIDHLWVNLSSPLLQNANCVVSC